MKLLVDGKTVTARTYYYLLDWRDRHHDKRPLQTMFGKGKLCELTLKEYFILFEKATDTDKLEIASKL